MEVLKETVIGSSPAAIVTSDIGGTPPFNYKPPTEC